ncbi:MAG: hypothetical protein FWF72_03135 [Paludibacter sp.]|nr:hypothetical protein [Paludibacter sp.]
MKKYILYITAIFLLFACANNKNGREATAQLAEIEQLINTEKYNAAMIAIDSFHIKFAQMVDLRRKALILEDTISVRQNRRIIAFCDSALAQCKQKLDSLHTFFRFEKNKKFQAIGSYVYKKQAHNDAIIGCFLETYVDENADFYLVENFYGILPDKNAIFLTVSFGNLYASTDTIPANSPVRHRFELDGSTLETLTLKNEQVEKFAAFINQFSDKNLIVLFGKTGKHQLTEIEKRSISITYQFWKLKKEIEKLKLQKEKAVKKSIAVLSR